MSFSLLASWFGLAGEIKRVQDHATNYGGECTVRFSQSLDPVRSWIAVDERTKNGVCRRLVVRWFVEMLKDKPEFWSSAIDQSGRLNGAFFGTIMMQQLNPGRVHVAPQGKERDVDEGDADTFEPLRALGCKEVNARNVEPATNPMGSLAEYVQGVTSLAAKYPKSRLCIFLGIGHSGISGGHIIGAMPSADGSVLLMDADAGEFCFPEASSLAKWMRKDLASLYRRMKYDKWFAVAYSKDK